MSANYTQVYEPLINTQVKLIVKYVETKDGRDYYKFQLETSQYGILFGKDNDIVDMPLFRYSRSYVLSQCLFFATLRLGDTDKEFFDSYTQAELEFAKSFLCEALQIKSVYGFQLRNDTHYYLV